MHDNDPQSDLEVIENDLVEATPIGLCTLDEIIAHLETRCDSGMIALARNPGSVCFSDYAWGERHKRQRLLNALTIARETEADGV
jgi:hypothetical protein